MKVYIVDIDETICFYENKREYELAKPLPERIQKINKLFDEGNRIIYWTARGTVTGIDWRLVTEKQLSLWGAKYHQLLLNKPQYDIFIDDKAINSESFFKELNDEKSV